MISNSDINASQYLVPVTKVYLNRHCSI